jgi:hypothetical protein
MLGPTVDFSSEETRRCIQACADCHQYCIETTVYCRQRGAAYADAAHLRLLLDCAELCHTTADFMLRGSELSIEICTLCSDVTERCAFSCERFDDDRQLRACAEACRRTVLLCRELARGLAASTFAG